MKKNKIARMLKLAESCRVHGGPVTDKNLNILPTLTQKQLLTEVSFLKATVAKEIKMKRRVKDKVSGKFSYVTFENGVLIDSIKNVVKPDDANLNNNLEELLLDAVQKQLK